VLCVLASLAIGAHQSAGQILETVNVQIINQNFDPARIRVVDDVCNVVVFEGQLLPDSSTPVSLCPDRQQRAHMTIYDAEGRAHRYNNLRQSEVYLPMR
jgi:RPA family protein